MRRTVIVLSVAGLLVFSGCLADPGAEDEAAAGDEPVDGELELHHIDVGQADATLIVTPAGETVLIDTGNWPNDGRDVVDYLEERGIDRVDHLVATHAHADHIGGHATVIEHFEEEGDGVGAVYDSGIVHTSQTYTEYLDAVEEYEVTLFEVAAGDEFPLDGDADVTVLNPPAEDAGDDFHENSVSVLVEFGEFSYLTTGDAESAAEKRILEEHGERIDADVYQAGHHGSRTSSTDPFLEAVDPEVAVVSSALDSQYGHPNGEVLETFAERGIETYWTAVHGAVVVRTDGAEISVETEADGPSDPSALHERRDEAQAEPALGPRAIDTAGAPATP